MINLQPVEARSYGGDFLRRTVKASLLAAALLVAACGASETKRENVSVAGWDITQDAVIKENQWIGKRHRSSLPQNENLRNVRDYTEKTGDTCYQYDKYGQCTFSLPDYDTFYDYEELDPVVVVDCRQEPVFTEYPSSEISADKACWERVQDGQWLEQQPLDYVLRITIPDGDKTYSCNAGVSESMYYQTAQQRSGLVAIEQGHCNITSLAFPDKK